MIINKKQKTKFAVAFVAACLILFVVAWFDESQPARKEKQDNPPDHQDSEATKKSSALVWGANKDNRQAEQQARSPLKPGYVFFVGICCLSTTDAPRSRLCLLILIAVPFQQ